MYRAFLLIGQLFACTIQTNPVSERLETGDASRRLYCHPPPSPHSDAKAHNSSTRAGVASGNVAVYSLRPELSLLYLPSRVYT